MIIITVCAFGMILLMLCVGAGVYGYVLFQRNFGRMVVQSPADLRKLTTEITDIEIPPQFTPIMGSAIFGMKSVNYAWNPEGKPLTIENWHQSRDSMLSMLTLMEMANDSVSGDQEFKVAEYEKKVLKKQYAEYEESLKTFEIRGRKCEFLFVTGRAHEGAFEDEELLYDEVDEEEMMAEEAAATTATKSSEESPVDATPPESTAPTGTPDPTTPPATDAAPTQKPARNLLPPVRTVTGRFPGKSGPTTITIRVPAEGTDEDFLLKMIQTIR